MDDLQLVAKAKKGNELAFVQLMETHQKSLYCTAYGIMGSSWDAYDVLQETFLKAYTSIHTLKDNSSFKFWLSRILINKCYDQKRKLKRIVPVEEVYETPCEFKGNEETMDLLHALEKLEEKNRTILSLRYFQDLPLKQMAEILECPEGTVKSRLNRALKELKEVLGYKNYEEVVQ